MTRKDIKANALSVFTYNYWPCVGAYVLVALITSAVGALSVPGVVASFFLIPVTLGLTVYYCDMIDGAKPTIGKIFNTAFDGKFYLRRVGGYAWMTLFTLLWSMLFVIPGIVKAYSYALTPYILARYPDVQAKDALKHSMNIMEGKKAELFVFQLSFLGWFILSAITFGLLGIFYVYPYYGLAETIWFKNTMDEAIQNGKFSYTSLV